MQMNALVRTLIAAAVLAAPAVAAAQTAPPATPVPEQRPQPRPAPVIVDTTQGGLQVRTLDDLRLDLDGQLLGLTTWQDAARDASDKAWAAIVDSGLDWQDAGRAPMVTYLSVGGSDYTQGKNLLNQGRFEDAITRFDKVVAAGKTNVDGALYWKAYAQFQLARTNDALATIAQLRKDVPQSRYLADAKMLEADVRRLSGQPVNPDTMANDEMKLLAINAMQRTAPERAIPLLEGVLSATNSLRVKKQTLYVLALSDQPRARDILMSYAKGAGNPDLQVEAIRYLALNRTNKVSSTELLQIYQSTQDQDVKLAIINSLRSAGDRSLFNFATTSDAPFVVRAPSAIGGLNGVLSPQDLMTLYEKETNKDLRLQIVGALGSMQAFDQMSMIVRNEKDQDVLRRAIRALGNQPVDKTGRLLADLYASETDADTRKVIIGALAAQSNAEGLVAIARQETSLPMKTEIVRRLSDLAPKSKVAADYLIEIIK
jgi:TolA-binding protein